MPETIPDPAEHLFQRIAAVRSVAQDGIGRIDSIIGRIKRGEYASIPADEEGAESDVGEAIANLMLAKRHLEDARLRAGMAIKAWDGGRSAYKR